MLRYKLTVAYDGTDFCGWQKQFPHADSVPTAPQMGDEGSGDERIVHAREENAEGVVQMRREDGMLGDAQDGRPRVELRTVQSVLERAVQRVVREPVILTGASRTDSGVHAKGQVAAFTCADTGGREGGWPLERGTASLVRAINSRLPGDVLVKSAEVVQLEFEPIRGATRKAYSYRIWTGEERPLWNRRTVLHMWNELDDRAMDEAARVIEGEHDFAAFAAAGHGRLSTVRRVFSCRVRREREREVVIDIEGSGFLWNMVRIIGGTLVEVGRGKRTAAEVRAALESRDRARAGPTLPAGGLCLEWIRY